MKRVFISVGMSGRNMKDVSNDIKRIKEKIKARFGEVSIVDNSKCIAPLSNISKNDKESRLYCLGEAIKLMGTCNMVIFADDWLDHNGCRIENAICNMYNINNMKESEL